MAENKQIRVFKIQLSVKSLKTAEELEQIMKDYMNENETIISSLHIQSLKLPEKYNG